MKSIEPIRVRAEEQIIIDDNLSAKSGQAIRLLTHHTHFNRHRHYFEMLYPNIRGNSYLSISHNYGIWYQIDVVIE
jgi:hypothetical protein